MIRQSLQAIAAVAALACALHGSRVAAAPGDVELISIDPSTGMALGRSTGEITGNGRYVLYVSVLPSGIGYGPYVLYDRETGQRSSPVLSASGEAPVVGFPFPAPVVSISPDGRYVAFYTEARNMDGLGKPGLFFRDRHTGAVTRMVIGLNGAEANREVYPTQISADGRFLLIVSEATNLVQGDTNGRWDLFVHDRQTGLNDRVTVSSTGREHNGSSGAAAMSADARFVVFTSTATNLVSNDANGSASDVFVRDRVSRTTELVTVSSSGAQSNGGSYNADISDDGRIVAFQSSGTNLVPGDTNGQDDVFVRDRSNATTRRVNVRADGSQVTTSHSGGPTVSADGRYVAYFSSSLLAGSGQGVFVSDLADGSIEYVVPGEIPDPITISDDGRFVCADTYESLVPEDKAGYDDEGYGYDVYVVERGDTAVPAAQFTLKPFALDFGATRVNQQKQELLWLRNKGVVPVVIRRLEMAGRNPGQFSIVSGCGATVAPGASCSIAVRFIPTSVGDKTAKVRLETTDGSIRTRRVQGVGIR